MLSRFKLLYRKYADGNINPVEFKELRDSIETVSDDHLWMAMLDSDKGDLTPMPEDMKESIRNSLRRSVMRLRFKSFSRYAAVAAVAAILVTTAVVISIGTSTVPTQEFTASIPAGSRSNITLPDQSKVQLNSSSELTFCRNTKGERIVRLNGEAYFDVAKDQEHTFRVIVSDIEVEVHGTSFNVNAYDDNIEVSLESGKVSLGGKGLAENRYIMRPGEKAVYNRADGSLSIAKADIDIETGWLRGDIAFEQKKLSDVIAMIERRYGVEIEMQCDSLADDTMTGVFSNEDLSDVLASLSNMYKFKYKINKNRITIY